MNRIKLWVWVGALLIAGLVYSQTRVATDERAFLDELMASVLSPDSPPPLNLPLVASNTVLESATFWSAQANEDSPPWPYNPVADLGLPVYSLGNNSFLFDDRAVNYVAWNQVQATMRQIASGGTTMNSLEFPGEGEGGGESGTNSSSGWVFGTNDLYLTLVSESLTNSGTIAITIHNPEGETNDLIGWYVWATTNLAYCDNPWALDADNWAWVAATEPGQTNVTVPALSDFATFYRLAHPTNDCDGDGLPDYYSFLHFGHQRGWESDHSHATNDFDSDGTSNYEEYLAVSNPNDLKASVHFPSLFVNEQTISGNCVVQSGVPFYMAVLVNSTNVTPGDLFAYSSNFSVTLGNTDGNYSVRVLLRGRPEDATPIFDDTEITLDRIAPVLTITNPISANATVIKPYLQLLGNANEPLASLTYDITNATDWRTNEFASVVDQHFDTNVFDFTTNYFQAYDVALATNVNFITLRVTDRAGNMTVTNLNVTLDYTDATNPPTLAVDWPPADTQVSGDSFYLRGQINDETATLTAQLIGGGSTNDVEGIVERNGVFWVEGLPLASGTNGVTLTATNAAGKVTTTNFNVVKSTLALEITSTPTGEALYEANGTVTGTVSDPSAVVTVNGMPASVDGSGNWTALNVPPQGMGTATYNATATPTGGPPTTNGKEIEMPAVIKVTKHITKQRVVSQNSSERWEKFYDAEWMSGSNAQWVAKQEKGHVLASFSDYYEEGSGTTSTDYNWGTGNYPGTYQTTNSWSTEVYTGEIDPEWSPKHLKSVPDASIDQEGSWQSPEILVYHYFARTRHEFGSGENLTTLIVGAVTMETLYTGGKALVNRKALHRITMSADEYGKPNNAWWEFTPPFGVDASRMEILGETVDGQFGVWRVLADNSNQVLGAKVKGAEHVVIRTDVKKYVPRIKLNNVILEPNEVVAGAKDFWVGQRLYFSVDWLPETPPIESSPQRWVLPGKYVNHEWQHRVWIEGDPGPPPLQGYWLDYGSVNYDIDYNKLTNSSTDCWYVRGEKAGAARIGVDMLFASGRKAFLIGKGKFDIQRPTLWGENMCQDLDPNSTVTNSNPCLSVVESSSDISLGNAQGGYARFWAGFFARPSDEFFETQLVQSFRQWGNNTPVTSGPDWWFDGTWNKPGGIRFATASGTAIVQQTDKYPRVPKEAPSVHVSDSFKTFIRFKPSEPDSIAITLGRVDWSWGADAQFINNQWIVTPGTIVPPNWQEDDSFPEWTGSHP